MDGKSIDIKQEKLDKLKELFPEAFTEDRVDWEKLKAALGEDINFSNERYVLNWAGKSDAFRALQVRTTATLIPDREESVNFDSANHIFIEGENLEVLKVLQKSYYGKIKMIYIDPPYNTGNDNFIYPDRFSENKDAYLKRIGDKDEEGYMTREGLFRKNSKDSGHYHSNWLSMMYPRLFLAKNLLKDDGVIFVSIDDREAPSLRILLNEIFGEENFLASFVWINEGNIDNQSKYKCNHEYILLYAKNEASIGFPLVVDPNIPDHSKLFKEYIENTIVKNGPANPISEIPIHKGFPANFESGEIHPKENYWPKLNKVVKVKNFKTQNKVTVSSGWSSKAIFEEFIQSGFKSVKDSRGQDTTFFITESGAILNRKKREQQSHVLTVLRNMGTVQDASSKLQELGLSFDYPKPVDLIKYLIKIGSMNNSIVMDFFAGSSPLAQATLDLNMQDAINLRFICVQLPEKCEEKSEAYKAGHKTIADIGKERIRRVVKKIQKEQKEKKDLFTDDSKSLDLGFKVLKLRPSNFKIWRGDVLENGEVLEKQLDAFVDPINKDAVEDNILFELLLKSGYDLNSKIEKKVCSKIIYYSIENGEMIIALSKINEALAKEMIKQNPRKVLCLDKLFAGNDQLKTNTVLQMKDAGIEFKTI